MNSLHNPKRQPTPFTAADGGECFHVPLANGRGVATIDADALPGVLAASVSRAWTFDSNGNGRRYVRAKFAGKKAVSVSRFIAGARTGQCVRYRDGNSLNLRRGNLYLTEGEAKMDCTALVAEHAEGEPKSSPQISARVSDSKGNAQYPLAPARAPTGAADAMLGAVA